jgi:hypothetical protein
MAQSTAKSEVARNRQRNPDGTYLKGAPKVVAKNAMPNKGDNSRFSDHVAGDPWIANPHDAFAQAAPPGIVPIAPGVWHANIFRMISQVPTQVYRNLDEALRASRVSAKAMLNDGAIASPLFQRILHLVSCNDGLVPEDENDPEQIAACEHLWGIVQETKNWSEFKRTLAEAIWYGKMLNVCSYRWEYVKGKQQMICKDFTPIIGDKLVFRTNGEIGYIVHQPTGLRDVVVTDIGRAELFNRDEYEALVHHKYFVVDTPFDEGMLAIGQEGFGYRNYLYYLWWLKQQVLEFAMLGLQIFGNGGLRIAYFEEGNLESMKAVAEAMAQANGTNIILFPRPIGVEKQGAGIEVVGPQGMGLDWFREFLSGYFGRQINELFLGGDYDGERRDLFAYLRYDAQKLSQTITDQFVRVLQKYNMPEYKHRIRYEISVPHYAPEMILTAAQRLFEMNAEVGAREVGGLVGLTVPGKGRKVLKKLPEEMAAGLQTMKKPIIGGDPMEHQLSGGTGKKEQLAANAHREDKEPAETAA